MYVRIEVWRRAFHFENANGGKGECFHGDNGPFSHRYMEILLVFLRARSATQGRFQWTQLAFEVLFLPMPHRNFCLTFVEIPLWRYFCALE